VSLDRSEEDDNRSEEASFHGANTANAEAPQIANISTVETLPALPVLCPKPVKPSPALLKGIVAGPTSSKTKKTNEKQWKGKLDKANNQIQELENHTRNAYSESSQLYENGKTAVSHLHKMLKTKQAICLKGIDENTKSGMQLIKLQTELTNAKSKLKKYQANEARMQREIDPKKKSSKQSKAKWIIEKRTLVAKAVVPLGTTVPVSTTPRHQKRITVYVLNCATNARCLINVIYQATITPLSLLCGILSCRFLRKYSGFLGREFSNYGIKPLLFYR
jgi:hypothetical protein